MRFAYRRTRSQIKELERSCGGVVVALEWCAGESSEEVGRGAANWMHCKALPREYAGDKLQGRLYDTNKRAPSIIKVWICI